jgi:hypothetical protein
LFETKLRSPNNPKAQRHSPPSKPDQPVPNAQLDQRCWLLPPGGTGYCSIQTAQGRRRDFLLLILTFFINIILLMNLTKIYF